VNPGQVGARERGIPDLGARAVDEVDDSGRQTGRLEELHEVVSRICGRRRGLPDNRVPHQRGAAWEISSDRGEVERRHREDEAFEGAVLHSVPRSRPRDGLFRVDAQHELDVEAEEVRQLARSIDLGLMRGLGLAQHRGGVQSCSPRPGQELRGSEEDRGPLFPGSSVPVLPGLCCCVDRLADVFRVALVHRREDVVLVVRHHRLEGLPGANLLAADHHRRLDLFGLHLLEPVAQLLALGRPRRVRLHRLVLRSRRAEEPGCSRHRGRL
jgi:hypothetical protein